MASGDLVTEGQLGAFSGAVVEALPSNKNNAVTLTAASDTFNAVTIQDDGTSTSSWPERLVFWYKTVANVARRTFYLNEYGEARIVPAKTNTTALRLMTKEMGSDPARDQSVPIMDMIDDRTNRNILFRLMPDGTVSAKNVQNKVVTVPVGTTGFSDQPDGTLWIEYTP